MRISELSAASGVSIPTLKFYLRKGMLERGDVTSPTRADYGSDHLERIALIGALTSVRGLPIARVRQILAIVDGAHDDPVDAMGRAVAALPPYDNESQSDDDSDALDATAAELPRAQHAARALGFAFDPAYPATRQLEAALEGLDNAGLPWNPDVARRYRDALVPLAEEELAPMDTMTPHESVSYAVLGTALYEPVILAIRRLAHRDRVVDHPTGQA
ncbi:MerR family transcriptional regulator [Marisediminicola sp. LYQ85]|uniref:MerR family transcriptional regulator n=1 Tax=Marisediminicola sp. LYQ85 TaxID=3391062 RepID=UPI003983A3DB